MPSQHQLIMQAWIARLVGLIDQASLLIKTSTSSPSNPRRGIAALRILRGN